MNDDRTCEHQRLRHESKRRTVCVQCGVEMVRDRGDWKPRPDSAGVLEVFREICG